VLIKRIAGIVMVCAFAALFAAAQENHNQSVLKEFTRSGQADGLTWSFVLLNDRTVDVLFQAPGKYAMRARANQATTFYVQAMPEKDIQLDPKFDVEQNDKTFVASVHSIKNFAAGTVAKGNRIDGILQLDQKLNLSHPFKIKGANNFSLEFKLSPEAVHLAEPIPPPSAQPANKQ
jgi:hypothetical protein